MAKFFKNLMGFFYKVRILGVRSHDQTSPDRYAGQASSRGAARVPTPGGHKKGHVLGAAGKFLEYLKGKAPTSAPP